MRKGLFDSWAWLVLSVMLVAPAAQGEDQMVSRGAYALQADIQGNAATTVVFESGFGQGGGVWKDVIAELGADCRCIAYARAGLGKSGTDGQPKTIEAHVADLAVILDTLAADQQVILVGHSYGGLLATEFARRYPRRLRGLVLVDPATMGQRHAFMQANRTRVLADDKALLAMLPPAMGADYRVLIEQLDSADAAQPRVLPDIPVALLTSWQVAAEPFVFEETKEGKALWKAQHGALFAGFSRGTHRYLAAGHNIHRENPKAVADAIRVVMAE